MHLKKLLMLSLLLILTNTVVFSNDFEFDPPSFQEGDNEEVTITIGNMRQALYYKETAELLKDKYNNTQGLLSEAIKDLSKTEAKVLQEKEKKIFYRNTTIAFIVVDTVAVLLLTRK